MFRPAFRLSVGTLALSAILLVAASQAAAKEHRTGGPSATGTASTWLAQLWCKIPITWGKNGCSVDPNGGQSKSGCHADPNGALGLGKAGCSVDPNGTGSPNKAGCHVDPNGLCMQ